MAELYALLKGTTPPKALVELCSEAPPAAPDGPALPAAGEDDDMDRRYVLRGSAAAGLLAALAALEKLVGVLPAAALGRLADDRHPVDGGSSPFMSPRPTPPFVPMPTLICPATGFWV